MWAVGTSQEVRFRVSISHSNFWGEVNSFIGIIPSFSVQGSHKTIKFSAIVPVERRNTFKYPELHINRPQNESHYSTAYLSTCLRVL